MYSTSDVVVVDLYLNISVRMPVLVALFFAKNCSRPSLSSRVFRIIYLSPVVLRDTVPQSS